MLSMYLSDQYTFHRKRVDNLIRAKGGRNWHSDQFMAKKCGNAIHFALFTCKQALPGHILCRPLRANPSFSIRNNVYAVRDFQTDKAICLAIHGLWSKGCSDKIQLSAGKF